MRASVEPRVPRRAARHVDRRRLRRRARAELGPHLPATVSPAAAHAQWIDRSIADIVAARGGDPVDTLLDLALESDLDCQFGIPIMNTDEDDRRRSCCAIRPASIALSDAGAHVDTLADQGFTTTLLAHWVRELGALLIERSGASA